MRQQFGWTNALAAMRPSGRIFFRIKFWKFSKQVYNRLDVERIVKTLSLTNPKNGLMIKA